MVFIFLAYFTLYNGLQETQKNPNRKAVLRKKNRAGGIMLPGFRSHYKDTVIKNLILAQKETHRSMKQNKTQRQTYGLM